jgi:hypothetical protein
MPLATGIAGEKGSTKLDQVTRCHHPSHETTGGRAEAVMLAALDVRERIQAGRRSDLADAVLFQARRQLRCVDRCRDRVNGRFGVLNHTRM